MRIKLQARILNAPHYLAYALIAIACLILLLRYPLRPESYAVEVPRDFAVYYSSWKMVQTGQSPYIPDLPSPYKYSPGVLASVGVLPNTPQQAWLVFSLFSILCMALALILGSRYRTLKSVGFLLLGLVLSWKGILETMDYGQVEILLFALAVLSGWASNRKPFIAGFVAGMLPWIKLHWGLLVIPLLLRSNRARSFIPGYFLGCFAWGAAVPSLVFGPDRALVLSQEWLAVLRAQPKSLFLSDMNQSLWISAMRWSEGVLAMPWVIGLVMAVLALLLGRMVTKVVTTQREGEVFQWLSPWIVMIPLLSPLSWRWASSLMIGAPFSVRHHSSGSFRMLIRACWVIVAVLWLLQQNPVVKALGFHHWTELHSAGVVTAYWFMLLVVGLI